MTPYMAQGAAQSMEDAAVLARCVVAARDDIPQAFRLYEAQRKPRTSRVQAISKANTWQRNPNDNPDWLYGYDAWTAPLEAGVGV
jgi:salicylate hydroxylase/6-hydroxynicotinate 3-monooxygenase